MKPESAFPRDFTQLVSAHWTVCAIALTAVVVVQIDWDAVASGFSPDAAPGYNGVVKLGATAWLLATAWLHAALARQRGQLSISAGRLRWHAVIDLCVAATTIFILWRGHESAIARNGLWSAPPALLAVASTSAVVLALEARAKRPTFSLSRHTTGEWVRMGISLVLLVVLAWPMLTMAGSAP
jgi:hypothetical protein